MKSIHFINCKSNKPASENISFENSKDRSKEESIKITTSVGAWSGSGSISAGSGSVTLSPAEAPKLEEQKSYAFSRQFLQKRKKFKSGEESSLEKMISMMGMQIQQDLQCAEMKWKTRENYVARNLPCNNKFFSRTSRWWTCLWWRWWVKTICPVMEKSATTISTCER